MVSPAPQDPPRAALLAGLVLLLATLLAHLPALAAGWLWDDDALVLNPLVAASDGLPGIWAGQAPQDYVPLTTSLYWLEFRLWGGHAAAFHAVALALHLAVVAALWRLLVALRLPGAWWGALLFAVHPLTVASVAWVSETKNMLSLLLAVLASRAWLAWLERGSRRALALGVLAFALALLAKTAVVMLPCLLLLLAWRRRGALARRDVLASAPFFAVSLALGLVTVHFQHARTLSAGIAGSESVALRAAAAGRAVWWYLGQALLPIDLTVVYARWEIDPSSVSAWLPLAALLLALALLLRARRIELRAAGVVLAGFTLLLLPALGIIEMSFMDIARVSDHYAYPALILLCAGVAAAGARLHAALRPPGAVGLVVVAAAVVTALGAASFARSRLYESQITLFGDNVRRVPQAWLAHNNLGAALLAQGDAAAAEPHLREAIRLLPIYAEPRSNLGALLLDSGRLDEAGQQLQEALRCSPDLAGARCNLGRLLLAQGRVEEALVQLRRAVELDPLQSDAHDVLGVALAQQGDPAAEASFRRALELRPDFPEALNNLGRLLMNRGELAEAESCLRRALALQPTYAAARENLAELDRRR